MKRILFCLALAFAAGCQSPKQSPQPIPQSTTNAPSIVQSPSIMPSISLPNPADAIVPLPPPPILPEVESGPSNTIRFVKSARELAEPLTVIQTPPSAMLLSAVDVGFTWNPSPDAGVAGYNLFFGGASRQYTNTINVGTNLIAVAKELAVGKMFFFAVTAYDASGVESDFSTEVAYTVPKWIQMTFAFNAPVSSPTIESSADLNTWVAAMTKPVSSTSQNVTVRAIVDQPSAFFRAVAVAP